MVNFKEEYLKCFRDKTRIYFIENYLSTYNAMDGKEVPFKLFPRQKVYLHAPLRYRNIVSKKHRQCGITTTTAAWATGQCVFALKGSPEIILIIANKLDLAEDLVNKMVTFLDQVPRWMWGGDYYSPDPSSEKNTKSIYVKRNKNYVELFNGCKIYARSSSQNAARGISSVTCLILDEAAFIENGMSVYTSAVSAQAAVANAKCFMISTPNGKDQLYYTTYSQAVKGLNNFHVVEFAWYQDLRYNRNLKWSKTDKKTGELIWDIDPVIDLKGNIVYDEERWTKLKQEGWIPTSPWYENMVRSFNNDERKIAQELDCSFLGSSDNVIPSEVIEMHRTLNVIKITSKWNLRDLGVRETWIWKDPIPNHRYVCAVDASSGAGDDNTAIEIIDVDAVDEDGNPCYEQVLEYYGKITGDEAAGLIQKYGGIYNDALVVVECIGGYGDAIVLQLMSMGYPNLYFDDPNIKAYTLKNYNTSFQKNGLKLPGFRSTGMRIQMISNFVNLLKSNTYKVRSERVISEMETWIFKNGRPDHMDGAHDDSLTCTAMGLFVMEHSMLKYDNMKQRDVAILKSWYVNTDKETVFGEPNKFNNQEVLDYNEMARTFSPFKSIEKDNKRHVNTCIMLGGFMV